MNSFIFFILNLNLKLRFNEMLTCVICWRVCFTRQFPATTPAKIGPILKSYINYNGLQYLVYKL